MRQRRTCLPPSVYSHLRGNRRTRCTRRRRFVYGVKHTVAPPPRSINRPAEESRAPQRDPHREPHSTDHKSRRNESPPESRPCGHSPPFASTRHCL